MPDRTDAAPSGTTRRDVLRRGGIVVGLAWTAPVVQSMLSPAFATGSQAEVGLCDRLVFIKWNPDPSDKKTYWENKEGVGNKSCYDNLIKTLPSAHLQTPPGPNYTVDPAQITKQTKWSATITDEGAITASYDTRLDAVTITAPENCRIVSFQTKVGGGNGCTLNSAQLQVQPFPTFITAMGQGRGKGLSHVDLILCCND